jgi:hypothetical protein
MQLLVRRGAASTQAQAAPLDGTHPEKEGAHALLPCHRGRESPPSSCAFLPLPQLHPVVLPLVLFIPMNHLLKLSLFSVLLPAARQIGKIEENVRKC